MHLAVGTFELPAMPLAWLIGDDFIQHTHDCWGGETKILKETAIA
jgi:hypothetical protein